MSGRKIIDGLNAALAFLDGDRTAGRVMERQPDGAWADVSAEWLAERGVASRPAKLTVVDAAPAPAAPREERGRARPPSTWPASSASP